MNTAEQIWFIVGVSGFVIFLEGAITFMVKKLFKGKAENLSKSTAGLIIFTLALLKLLEVF